MSYASVPQIIDRCSTPGLTHGCLQRKVQLCQKALDLSVSWWWWCKISDCPDLFSADSSRTIKATWTTRASSMLIGGCETNHLKVALTLPAFGHKFCSQGKSTWSVAKPDLSPRIAPFRVSLVYVYWSQPQSCKDAYSGYCHAAKLSVASRSSDVRAAGLSHWLSCSSRLSRILSPIADSAKSKCASTRTELHVAAWLHNSSQPC